MKSVAKIEWKEDSHRFCLDILDDPVPHIMVSVDKDGDRVLYTILPNWAIKAAAEALDEI